MCQYLDWWLPKECAIKPWVIVKHLPGYHGCPLLQQGDHNLNLQSVAECSEWKSHKIVACGEKLACLDTLTAVWRLAMVSKSEMSGQLDHRMMCFMPLSLISNFRGCYSICKFEKCWSKSSSCPKTCPRINFTYYIKATILAELTWRSILLNSGWLATSQKPHRD